MTSTVVATSKKQKEHHGALYLIDLDKTEITTEMEKLTLVTTHEVKEMEEQLKLDASDKVVVAQDKKIIDLLHEKLSVAKSANDVLKTLKLELEAFKAGNKLAQNKLHYEAGKMKNEMTLKRYNIDIKILKLRIERGTHIHTLMKEHETFALSQ